MFRRCRIFTDTPECRWAPQQMSQRDGRFNQRRFPIPPLTSHRPPVSQPQLTRLRRQQLRRVVSGCVGTDTPPFD